MQNKWVENLDENAYHADKDTVSSTQLRRILKSPALFKAHWDGVIRQETTDAMRFGTLAHKAILEGGVYLKKYAIVPDFSKYGHHASNAHKNAKKAWKEENADRIQVTQEQFDDIRGMIDSVVAHPDALMLLSGGKAELSGFYKDPETGIQCRLRVDYLSLTSNAIVDVKTTEDCSAEAYARSIWNFRYDFQMAMYDAGVYEISKRPIGTHAFIAIEKKKPYDVAVYLADSQMIAIGYKDYRAALVKLKECRDSEIWDSYQTKMQPISLPRWVSSEFNF